MTICKELRQAVLQAAIKGKLTEQRESDGTAEELLEEIKKEKDRLIKEGKNKKEKPLPEISEDEIPFDIPDSWRWVRLQEAAQTIVDCPHSTPKYYDEMTGFYAIGTKCLNGRGEITKLFNIDGETYRKRVERLVPQENDVVYSREGSIICRAVLLPGDKKICLGQRVMLIRCSGGLDPVYIQKYLMMDTTIAVLTKNYKGVGVKHINVADVISIPIPLPPLAEQHRIVSAVNTLMEKIDDLQVVESELEAMKTSFPGDMRDAILQAAMQGKLTEQLENDGTAEELLKEISAEKDRLIKAGKIKKEKALPEISEDEIPFDIPENWKWVRFGTTISLLSGSDLPSDQYNDNAKGMVYITGASNIENDKVIINRWTEYPKSIAKKGDILLTCKGTIGTTCFLTIDEAHIARQIMAIHCLQIDSIFARAFLSYYVDNLKRQAKSMIPGIERKTVNEALFPLPPLPEQRRIVDRLNELLPLCDTLEEAR